MPAPETPASVSRVRDDAVGSVAIHPPATTLPTSYARWLHRALAVIADSAEALNAMNVFPVSDSDTGSNLELTLSGIVQAVPEGTRAYPDDVVQAAVLSAHGNSGAILAEMVTSVCRLLEQARPGRGPAGVAVADMLQTVATAATQAVARPVAGTILTVADAAASAARTAAAANPTDALAVARAAQDAAAAALAHTPDQLTVLAEAGVVDAGGQAYVLLLDVLVEVLGGDQARPLPEPTAASEARSAATAAPVAVATELEYEVMYTVRGTAAERLAALREELSVLGHSVVVVGDRTVAQVHVHLPDAGAAVEAGLGYGSVSQIRVTALPSIRTTPGAPVAPGPDTQKRAVVAVVAGPGLAETVSSLGGIAVLPAGRHLKVEELAAPLRATGGDIVILPNDMESLEIAGHLAAELRGPGRRIAVIPTVSQTQGLAAIAVHEPTADFDSAVVAMSSTAGHTRHGAVTVAESPAMTMAGRCEAGDVLGLVDGDFVEIGEDLADVAWRVTQRLISGGGELLTIVLGADTDPGLADGLRSRALGTGWPDVEIVVGGQPRYPLLLGLE